MKKPKKYRHKPKEIQAIQWTGNNEQEVVEFISKLGVDVLDSYVRPDFIGQDVLWIKVPFEAMPSEVFYIDLNCFLIDDGQPTSYPLITSEKKFKATYEAIE